MRWRGRCLAAAIVTGAVLAIAQPGLAFMTEVESVEDGVILNVSPSKILYRDDYSSSTGLHIKDRATGAVEDVPSPHPFPIYGYLSPHGAIFVAGNHPNVGVYEWRDGVLLHHGLPDSPSALRVSGHYAVWSQNNPTCCAYALYRRDLAAGTTVQVADDSASGDFDVVANGDVYYWTHPGRQVFRWQDAMTEQLTHDEGTYWNLWVRSDGINVAYQKRVPVTAGNSPAAPTLLTADGEIMLDGFRPDGVGLSPGEHYDVAGGWTAFTKIGPDDTTQVWRRSPGGVTSQLSPSGLATRLTGLNGAGDVLFTAIHEPGFFMTRPTGPPADIGTRTSGFSYYFYFSAGGKWFAAMDNVIYELSTGYPRPRGATPTRYSLVTAYEPCTTPNRTHGPPLAFQSCNPPEKSSQHVTVGTGDSNGQPAKSNGRVLLSVIVGNPATPADEADLKLEVEITDVRRTSDLQDYTGELLLDSSLRITDRDTEAVGGGSTHGTMGELEFDFPITCTPTADTTVGSTCSLNTTLDAGGGSFVKEGRRSMWQLSDPRVYDGGPDGDAQTLDNTLFAVPGVFVP